MKKFILLLLSLWLLSGCALPVPIDLGTPMVPIQPTDTSPAAGYTPTANSSAIPLATETSASTYVPPASTSVRTPLPSSTPLPSETPPAPDTHVYSIQPGSPVYSPNIFHPDLGCNWTGVAGQVLGPDGRPVNNIVVTITGQLNGMAVNLASVTGSTPAYGEGGYELTLSTSPADTVGSLWIQLYDMSGNEISESQPLVTHSTCDQNLLLMNFIYTRQLGFHVYLPFIVNSHANP